MFKAYFDDSTNDEGGRTLVLAGCVQSYRVWANFSMGWEAALAMEPSIKYFHMREARSLKGEFHRWKKSDVDRKINYLAKVIASYRPWTISGWISRREHDAILKPISPHMIRHPYNSLFCAVILKLAQWHLDMGVKGPITYVFDEQGSVGVDSVVWYEHIKGWQEPERAALMGGSPEFKDDKIVLPLQAADMLAWHIRRWKDSPDENRSRWATAPLDELTYAEFKITKDVLISVAEQMQKVPNINLVQGKSKDLSRTEFNALVRSLPVRRDEI